MTCERFRFIDKNGVEVVGIACSRGAGGGLGFGPLRVFRCAQCRKKFDVHGEPKTKPYVCSGCLKEKR